jgi:hypothetical protein
LIIYIFQNTAVINDISRALIPIRTAVSLHILTSIHVRSAVAPSFIAIHQLPVVCISQAMMGPHLFPSWEDSTKARPDVFMSGYLEDQRVGDDGFEPLAPKGYGLQPYAGPNLPYLHLPNASFVFPAGAEVTPLEVLTSLPLVRQFLIS